MIPINSFVVFDIKSCSKEQYKKYYEETFPKGKLFIFLGEVLQTPGHCILLDLSTGKVIGLYHMMNFRLATQDEC